MDFWKYLTIRYSLVNGNIAWKYYRNNNNNTRTFASIEIDV